MGSLSELKLIKANLDSLPPDARDELFESLRIRGEITELRERLELLEHLEMLAKREITEKFKQTYINNINISYKKKGEDETKELVANLTSYDYDSLKYSDLRRSWRPEALRARRELTSDDMYEKYYSLTIKMHGKTEEGKQLIIIMKFNFDKPPEILELEYEDRTYNFNDYDLQLEIEGVSGGGKSIRSRRRKTKKRKSKKRKYKRSRRSKRSKRR